MNLPIDVKAVFDAACDIDAARKRPIGVALYLDASASDDVIDCVRTAFGTTAPQVRETIEVYPNAAASSAATMDLAVVVAGFEPTTGEFVQRLHREGTPVVVVTTMPEIVKGLALEAGYPLSDEDVVAPSIEVDGSALPADSDFNAEPYPLTIDRIDTLLIRLGEWVVETFRDARLAFALAFPFVRKPLSLDAVRATSMQNAGIGLVMFIPGADMPVMTLNQAKMLLQIAAAYGQPLGMERVKELAAVVGGAFVCRGAARQLIAVVPALGWAVKAVIGYTGTMAMGYAAIEYFEGGGTMSSFAATMGRVRDKAVSVADEARQAPDPAAAVRSVRRRVADGVAVSDAVDALKRGGKAVQQTVGDIAEAAGVERSEIGRVVVDVVTDKLKGRR